jgi:hypothetical protein
MLQKVRGLTMDLTVDLRTAEYEKMLALAVGALSRAEKPDHKRACREIRNSIIFTMFKNGYPRTDLAKKAQIAQSMSE